MNLKLYKNEEFVTVNTAGLRIKKIGSANGEHNKNGRVRRFYTHNIPQGQKAQANNRES